MLVKCIKAAGSNNSLQFKGLYNVKWDEIWLMTWVGKGMAEGLHGLCQGTLF